MVRDNDLEDRKDAAWERGMELGYVAKPFTWHAEELGYDPESPEWDAFRDGYEDGRALREHQKSSDSHRPA